MPLEVNFYLTIRINNENVNRSPKLSLLLLISNVRFARNVKYEPETSDICREPN